MTRSVAFLGIASSLAWLERSVYVGDTAVDKTRKQGIVLGRAWRSAFRIFFLVDVRKSWKVLSGESQD